ncbi:MAG: hypothetical protein K2G36_05050 [Ruminococcus sp.]|nr:hypothetical protein [Ruminococcus sp.]
MKNHIFMDDIFLYIQLFGVIAVVIYLFINKSTRKIAFRILKIVIIGIAVLAGVCVLCMYLFGETGILIGGLIFTNICISITLLYVIREQVNVTKLHKKGCRTYGTITNVVPGVRGGHNDIIYRVDGKEYKHSNGRPVGKWEIGYDKIAMLYDPHNPENVCLEKYDLVSAISFTVAFALIDVVFTGSTIYLITYLI